MQPAQNLNAIKAAFFSPDTIVATVASDKLGEIGGEDIVAFLIPVLESNNARLRTSVALALPDIGDNRALGPLFWAIQNPQNANNQGRAG